MTEDVGSEYLRRCLPQVRKRVLEITPCPLVSGAFVTKMTKRGFEVSCKARRDNEFPKCAICDGSVPSGIEIISQKEFERMKSEVIPTAPYPGMKDIMAYLGYKMGFHRIW